MKPTAFRRWHFLVSTLSYWTSRWLNSRESACQCRRCGRCQFDPWVEFDLLEEEMAPHSGILAWAIPWTEEPGGLQSAGSKKSQIQLTMPSVLVTVTGHHTLIQPRIFIRLDSSLFPPCHWVGRTGSVLCNQGRGEVPRTSQVKGSVLHRNAAQLSSLLFFLAVPHSMWWDLSSLARDWTPPPALGTPSLKPQDPHGSPSRALEKWSCYRGNYF